MFPTLIDPSFQADSLFSPDDCVLSDVSLSDALDRRELNLDRRDFNAERREFNLNEKHYTDDKQVLIHIVIVFKMISILMLQYGIEREYGSTAEKQNYGGSNNLSCSSLHSDGDSYPNSPINGENILNIREYIQTNITESNPDDSSNKQNYGPATSDVRRPIAMD